MTALNPYGMLCGGLLLLIMVSYLSVALTLLDCRQGDRPKEHRRAENRIHF